jgi:hypothetical protein
MAANGQLSTCGTCLSTSRVGGFWIYFLTQNPTAITKAMTRHEGSLLSVLVSGLHRKLFMSRGSRILKAEVGSASGTTGVQTRVGRSTSIGHSISVAHVTCAWGGSLALPFVW